MTLLAFSLTLIGAALFYLAAPRQAWLSRPLSAGPARFAGAATLLLALVAWQSMTTPLTGLFVLATLLMVMLAALPWLALARSAAAGE